MSKFTVAYNNFSGGKVSDKFKGRFDTQSYANSLEEFKNMFMGKIGGAYKRTGTVLVHNLTETISDISDTHTSIPFDTGIGVNYTVFMPAVTVKLDGALSYDIVILENSDSVGLGADYQLGSGLTSIVLSGYPAWPSTENVAFSEGHWTWQQVGDLLFLTHTSGEQRPLVIARTSPSTFEVNYYDTYQTETDNLDPVLRVPYSKNLSKKTFSITGTTLTSSNSYFTADMVGSHVRLNSGGNSDVVVITGYTSDTVMTVLYAIGSTPSASTDDWEISMWSDEWGWPTSVTYHQQRLFWGGTPKKNSDVIWGSRLGNLFHMMRERLDQDGSTDVSTINYFGDASFSTDPTDFRPASTEANATTWISGGRVLMSGTSGGENLISFGAETLDIKENSNYGSSNSQVIKAGKDVIFVSKDKRSLRTYRYSDENGSWLSDDLSSKADTLFLDGAILASDFPTIKQISWNSEYKQVWVVMSNFTVKVLSYDPEFGLNGWSDFEIGGENTFDVLGVTNMASPDRSRVETYLTVSRDLTNAITFEKVMGEFKNTSINAFSSTDIFDFPRFVDFGQLVTADGSGVADGPIFADYIGNFFDCIYMTVDSFAYELTVEVILDGGIGTLDFTFPAGAKVLFGYKYDAELKTLPPEAGGQYGTSLADIKHIHESYLKLYRTKDFSIGSKDKKSGVDLQFENVTYDDLETGDKTIHIQDNPDTEGQIIVRSTTPTPLNILALVNKGVAYD